MACHSGARGLSKVGRNDRKQVWGVPAFRARIPRFLRQFICRPAKSGRENACAVGQLKRPDFLAGGG
jgi:hypothetical protein